MKRKLYQLWYDAICAQYRYAFWRNVRASKALDKASEKTAKAHAIKQAFEKALVDVIVSNPKFKKVE